MRAIRVASAALLGVTALSLTAPAAHAARAGDFTSFGFRVVPSTIAAGRPTHHPTHHPSGGSHAGGGGTLAGLDLREIGLGAALVAGSLGAAWHWSRRRTEDGDHS